jgi:DNA repair protein RecN (Recombination protein N)
LRTLAGTVSEALEGDEEAALTRLGALQKSLAHLQRIDPSLARLQDGFDAGYYALQALARDLAAYASSVDLDPDRLADVTRRRDAIFKLIRKHGPTLDDVIATGAKARVELDLVDSASLDLAELTERESAAATTLEREATALTKLRRAAAARLAKAVDVLLPELGMPDGQFAAALIPQAEVAATGGELVEFRVALNLGHDARPLARVASGGELSRVMLALKTILARLDHVPTLVFDEVDAGIGGRVGLQVGETMRRVAEHHQVFAISHLPQLAARAHHHIVVSKGARGGVTTADVRVVTGDVRVTEIARMLGGDPDSAASLTHAAELLATAASPGGGEPVATTGRSGVKGRR